MNRMVIRANIDLLPCVLVMFFLISTAGAGQSSYTLPTAVDTTARYLFFFHNYYVEVNGPHGDCRYFDLLNAFAKEDVIVVSEVRTDIVSSKDYAKKAAQQIQTLLAAGVPPENITISGHSKGGVIALHVSSLLQQPDIKYIILAGCGIKPLAQAYPEPSTIKGTFLSLYANSDKIAENCNAVLLSSGQEVSSREIILDSPEGHRLFFKPDRIWLEPITSMLAQ